MEKTGCKKQEGKKQESKRQEGKMQETVRHDFPLHMAPFTTDSILPTDIYVAAGRRVAPIAASAAEALIAVPA
jgi:hypothetical protein